MTQKRLSGRIALITGASRGLGAAIAEAYAAEGAHVILTARTVGGLEETDDRIRAAGGTATLLPFDLTETKKIPAIATAITERFGTLDILVGNAAVLGTLSPVALSEADKYDDVFRINFFANYHLIRALDPLLRHSGTGRAIFVTTSETRFKPFWSAYAASKSALDAMVQCYAKESTHSGICANIVNPGALRTAMRADAMPAEDPNTVPLPATVVETFIQLGMADNTRTAEIINAAA